MLWIRAIICLQALGLVVPLFPFYFAYKRWQDSFVFKSYLAPAALILWWCACSFYNLRMFYRVPHRSPIEEPINSIELTNRITSSIKSIFQAVPQSPKRHLQSCPQSNASLAEEAGSALPSKWDIPCGHWQEWLEGGFFRQLVSLTSLSHYRWLESQSSSWFPCRELCGSIKILSTRQKTIGSSVGGK